MISIKSFVIFTLCVSVPVSTTYGTGIPAQNDQQGVNQPVRNLRGQTFGLLSSLLDCDKTSGVTTGWGTVGTNVGTTYELPCDETSTGTTNTGTTNTGTTYTGTTSTGTTGTTSTANTGTTTTTANTASVAATPCADDTATASATATATANAITNAMTSAAANYGTTTGTSYGIPC